MKNGFHYFYIGQMESINKGCKIFEEYVNHGLCLHINIDWEN